MSFGFSLILSGVMVQNGNVGTSWGGGIYVWGSTLTLTDVTIRASTAGIGGGLDLEGGAQASLTRVTLSGNTATTNDGGGINVAASTANLVNVTLSGNAATKAGVSEGGAIYLDGGGSSVSLTNCTIAGNSAIIGGGGIRRNGGTITLKNTIVANNTSGNCSGTITSGGNNLDSANTCAFAGAGDKINSNPLLGALQDNGGPTDTLALATGSPAIDAGTATGAPATDQRGVLRPQGAAYDIGAFERAGYSIAGRVFEDANFAGTASGWDGGASDLGLANVDVELYNAGTNAYITSTTTAAGGTFSFSIVANGSYKVRVRSATIGDADTVPKGGLNGTVPATWPYPLAEMTWGNGAALYGGQSATVDDTATGDNAGPGDTFVPVTVSGADVTGVDLGFAYNLIVNAGSDANADATRSKQGTLRQFIKNGNATGSAGGTTANASQFRIPATDPNYNAGTGVFTISPTTVLPLISDPLVLDGQTQPGWTSAPIVELAGPGGSYEGLRVSGGSSTLRGLAIDRFTVGILLMTNGNNVIEACSIGTNAAGNAAAPNTTYGVWVNNTAGNRIGGTTPGSGNVISGNASQGIYLFNAGATGNLVQGNFIGTNAAGSAAIANGDGIGIGSALNNTIGGTTSNARNVISGNSSGVVIWSAGGGASGNLIQGNYIGLGANGTTALANTRYGINIFDASSNTIGGAAAPPGSPPGNVISGNGWEGVHLTVLSGTTTGNLVRGNSIGANAAGGAAVPNGLGGVRIDAGASGNAIGGTGANEGNVIRGNTGKGVIVVDNNTTLNGILGNAIYGQTGLGIDLYDDLVTANNGTKNNSRPNADMDFPVFTSAVLTGSTLAVTGYVGSAAGQATFANARVEIFKSDNDASGNGEGQSYLGVLTTTVANGNFSGSIPVTGLTGGDKITGTATDGSNNTSEFGPNFTVIVASAITGGVFEDANFAGTASGWDGGAADLGLANVDVELYNAGTNAYIASATTAAGGTFTFGNVANGNYKVRVRSATIGDADTPPKGALNATVPATWPYPLAEMTWGNGVALYGGQSATVDDTATGDNAGPGDTFVTVTVSGADVTGVDLGFAYNLIVNAGSDANADTARSKQGSVRQFLKNANAIGSAGGTTANASQFRIPTSDPNYNAGIGVFTISPTTLLPAIADAGTTLDAATQTASVGNTNTAVLGTGGTVGVDSLPLGQVAGPEVEIRDGAALATGVRLQANDATVRGFAIRGFGAADGEADVRIDNNVTGALIENNVLGSAATAFADPGASERGKAGVDSQGGDSGIIRNNLIGFHDARGIFLFGASNGWSIVGNEIRDNGLPTDDGDGIAVNGSSSSVSTGNLIVGSSSQGYVLNNGASGNTFTNNTVIGNGVGYPSGLTQSAAVTLRTTATTTLLDRNVIRANYGAGVQVNNGAATTRLTRNSIFDNGTITARNGGAATGQIGIDLNAAGDDANLGTPPFVTLNDNGDGDAGGNGLLNFPILSTADIAAGNLVLAGYARPGSVIELFVVAADPSGFGEGQTWKLTLTEGGTGAGGDDPYADTDAGTGTYGPGAINGLSQGTDTTNKFRFTFPVPAGVAAGTKLSATATIAGSTSEFSGNVTVAVGPADLVLTKADNPDPAPAGGELLYTLVVTNNGPNHATNVVVTDTLPAGVSLISATPSQGSCSGTSPVICTLGGILNGGTASIEILVVTGSAGSITNNASVTATETDPVPANNAASATTTVVNGGTTDIPLTLYRRIHGFVDSTVTGGSLRTQHNPPGGDACLVAASSTAALSGIPNSATVVGAYLYWAGSGSAVDSQVTLDAASLTADRTWTARYVLSGTSYDFFGGFEDVTAYVQANRNKNYTFGGLTVATGDQWCDIQAVLAGWALIVIYEDSSVTGKTLVLYDGFDITRNGSSSYVLSGIYASPPPEGRTRYLVGKETSR